jgi:hypothetical protein
VGGPHRLRRRSPRRAGQQRHRERDARPRHRAEEPLLLESRRGTEVAALFYTIFETAKLAGIDPKAYLRRTAHAILMGERVRLPHEIAAAAAA